jgi:hypothetical protein
LVLSLLSNIKPFAWKHTRTEGGSVEFGLLQIHFQPCILLAESISYDFCRPIRFHNSRKKPFSSKFTILFSLALGAFWRRKGQLHGVKKRSKTGVKRVYQVGLWIVFPNELNEILRKFYAEVKRTEEGQPLTPNALTAIRAAIHRCITSTPISRNINILQDSEFMSPKNVWDESEIVHKKNERQAKT